MQLLLQRTELRTLYNHYLGLSYDLYICLYIVMTDGDKTSYRNVSVLSVWFGHLSVSETVFSRTWKEIKYNDSKTDNFGGNA